MHFPPFVFDRAPCGVTLPPPRPVRCGTARRPHLFARPFEGRCRVQFLRPSFSCCPTGLLCFKRADPGEVRVG